MQSTVISERSLVHSGTAECMVLLVFKQAKVTFHLALSRAVSVAVLPFLTRWCF